MCIFSASIMMEMANAKETSYIPQHSLISNDFKEKYDNYAIQLCQLRDEIYKMGQTKIVQLNTTKIIYTKEITDFIVPLKLESMEKYDMIRCFNGKKENIPETVETKR